MEKSVKKENILLRPRIVAKYDNLTPKERKIADYLLKNHSTAFSLSAADLAEKTGVSLATVVRFSRHIGFSGFYQLRAHMINEVKEELIPEERFKLLSHNKDSLSTLVKIAKQDVENINQTLNAIDRKNFKIFITELRKAKSVYTIGIGISSILARSAAYLLKQAGLRAHFCGQDEHSFIEVLINLDKKDAVFGFSFPPYSGETVKAMKFCYEHGLTCLSITDKMTSPITKWSNVYLRAQTKNLMFTNSISSVLMIINALSTEIALINKAKIVPNIDLMYGLLKNEYLT